MKSVKEYKIIIIIKTVNQIYLWLSRYIKDIPIQFPSINIDFPCIIWSSFCLCKRINWIIFHYSRCLHVSAIFQFILVVFIFTFLFAIIFLELLLIVKINWSRFFAYVLQQRQDIFLINLFYLRLQALRWVIILDESL